MTKASGVEKKITPDKWELFTLSTKRGLGMPQKDQEFQSERSIIGIFLAHQNVQSDANNYSTSMTVDQQQISA